MTEPEWLTCQDAGAMLKFLHRKKSQRKQRLFACACCRLVWEQIPSDWHRAVDLNEQYADGRVTKEDVRAALGRWSPTQGFQVVAFACDVTHPINQVTDNAAYQTGLARPGAKAKICEVLRDIFGNPFRLIKLNRLWGTLTVAQLAEAIYQDRAFDRLPILADALEDAGCDNAEILNHCRQPGEHVRGCWVVDLLLNKK